MGGPQVDSGSFGYVRSGNLGGGMGSLSRPMTYGNQPPMHSMGGQDFNQYPGNGSRFPLSYSNPPIRTSSGDGGQQYGFAGGAHASNSGQGADQVLLRPQFTADEPQALLQTYGGTGASIDDDLFNGEGPSLTGDIASDLGIL